MVRRADRDESIDSVSLDDVQSIEMTRDYDPDHTQLPMKSSYQPDKKTTLIDLLKSKLFISFVIVSAVIITLLCIGLVVNYERENDVVYSIDALREDLSSEQTEWFDSGLDELKNALRVRINTKRARNVILFVGDGMGPTTVTATRIYKYGEGGQLSWEQFPHLGILKTYCYDKQVPDSSATATALFTGIKTNYKTVGVDSYVTVDDCKASLNESHHVNSILKWAQDEGMSTGFVTTTRVVHATPSTLYSHAPNRKWECEQKIPLAAKQMGCKDIARQLIENEPGKNINVIMGGGRQCLVSNVTDTLKDPIDTYSCVSLDGRDLIKDWKFDKVARKIRQAVVQNNEELENLKTDEVDFVLGIFANGHLKYDHERDQGPLGMPSLKEMTEQAIKVLRKNSKGFILVVEGGLIDQAHHRGWAKHALSETSAMDDAVNATLALMKDELDETLIIVTADHSHTLSINGYPKRGNNILGIAENSVTDNIPYTTLTYATGHYGYQVEIDVDGKPKRKDPSKEDTTAYGYIQQTAIFTDENTHGGTDVTIHAIGPMAHLFHRVHEQSYVAHIISYAARIGRFRNNRLVQAFVDLFNS